MQNVFQYKTNVLAVTFRAAILFSRKLHGFPKKTIHNLLSPIAVPNC